VSDPPNTMAVAGSGGGTTVMMTGSGGAPSMVGQLSGKVPCGVASTVSKNCTLCHGAKLQAPMTLLTLADFHAMSHNDKTKHVYEVIPTRINATVPAMRMPPISQPALAQADLDAFNSWLTAGAPGDANGCDIVSMTDPGTTGMAGAGGGVVKNPSGMGGSSDKPIEYNDPEMKCYEFRAHAEGDMTAPFSVGTKPDLYTNFTFDAPWTGKQYFRSFEVLTDNLDVIHHWLFYKNIAPGGGGSVTGSSGAHPDGQLEHGWAPGGSDLFLDYDVGIEAPSDVSYTLETHHNNMTGAPSPDASGVRVCVTPKVPTHEASLSWLGTDGINGTSASGTCTPTSSEPITVLGATPHMHTKGAHMKVVLTRAGGAQEILHDLDFDFSDQRSYPVSTVVMPGDSITTTCSYNAPATFGEGTSDEMCYFFTLYYPPLSLTNGNPIANIIHGPNTCLQ
jgi:hypothetical protein